MEVILPIVIAAVVLVLGVFGLLQAQKRRETLLALANSLGLRFDPGHDRGHDDVYGHFEIFRRGHSRSAYNTIWGETELAGRRVGVRMGDFKYKQTSGSGKNRSTRTYRFSYCIVHLPWPHAPNLLIRREGLFDKLASIVGFDDIDFESVEFSKKFCVKSPNKRFAYDIIDPRMMEFLMQCDVRTPIDIERGRLCLSNGVGTWRAESFAAQLRFAGAFLDRWPEHAVRSLEEAMTGRRAV